MKKTIFTLSLLLIAATLIFTGCSSKGDFELERSKGIKVTYIDEFEKTESQRTKKNNLSRSIYDCWDRNAK